MIVCGDFIDAQFGVMFGLTTMASAGSKKKIKLEQVRKTDHVWIYTVCIYICIFPQIYILAYVRIRGKGDDTTVLNNGFRSVSWEYLRTSQYSGMG